MTFVKLKIAKLLSFNSFQVLSLENGFLRIIQFTFDSFIFMRNLWQKKSSREASKIFIKLEKFLDCNKGPFGRDVCQASSQQKRVDFEAGGFVKHRLMR